MSATSIPDALVMQDLKYGNRSDAEKDAVAEALRERGRRAEAVLLFEGRADHPFVQEERRWALENGVAFHLLTLRRLGAKVADDDLRVCATTAERRERWMDARLCWQALDEPDEIARIAEHLPESLRPEPAPEEEEAEEGA